MYLDQSFFLPKVNTLLQAQSPASQSLNTTPKMEASTSTGESLYWPNHSSTPSQPSLFTPSRSTHSTPSQPHTRTSMEREESMCSSIVSGLSVETATSTLSHNVSDMHVDLQSYGIYMYMYYVHQEHMTCAPVCTC